MKILFINISDTKGGAAIAAYRVAKHLNSNLGSEYLFLVRNKYSKDSRVLQTRTNFQALIERWVNIFFNLIGLQYFYLPFSPKYIMRKAAEFKPDVISLNNIIGGYFETDDLIKLCKIAPVVWTFHDMWPFTANAAQTFGDESWKELESGKKEKYIYPWIGINTGGYLIKRKKKIYSRSEFAVISPSRWMHNLTGHSPLLENKNKYMIYNGIDLKLFKPLNKEETRKKYGIPADADVLLFSAERLKNNLWKGGADLVEILKHVHYKIEGKLHLIIVGQGSIDELNGFENFELIKTGFVENEEKLVDYYNCADLTVYPTKADTLSLVLVESIACGTPAVTYDIGGPNEVILENTSGYLAAPFDKVEFAEKIVSVITNKSRLMELSVSARKHAEENFSIEDVAKQYYDIFKKEIESRDSRD